MRRFLLIPLALLWASLASAQGLFSPAIVVNGDAITRYELSQREAMLRAFNTPGDLAQIARDQLIDDRLKLQELARAGIAIRPEALRREMEAFSERTNMTYPQFIATLQSAGVAEETLRDFVRVGITWRDYIRQQYGSAVDVGPDSIDRALNTQIGNKAKVQVLLSEIIIPAPPQNAAAAMAEAQRISQMRSTSDFEAAARRVSALPSKERGGRLDWVPISNYPAALHSMIIGLSVGEVTPPIPIPNGVALFQMRGVREVADAAAAPAEIEYLTFALPGGADAATEAARIRENVDRCDDFYGVARGVDPRRLQRQSVAPGAIPADIASVLAGLDANEVSWGPLRNNGQTMLMVMMCGRMPAGAPEREQIGNSLLGQQLEGYAERLLADLRARASIQIR